MNTTTIGTTSPSTTKAFNMGLPRRSRSPSQTPLPILNPNHMTPVIGERPKLRHTPKKTTSFNMDRKRSAVRSILGAVGGDSAPVLPDRSVESMNSPNKTARPVVRNARSAVFRAAEGGHQDVLPVSLVPQPEPLRPRARTTSGNVMHRPYGSTNALITSDQLQTSANTIRSRRKTSSYRYDENASHRSDDRSVEFGLELCQEDTFNDSSLQQQQPLHARPVIFSDDIVEGDEMSLGASKKIAASRSFLPYNGKFLSKLRNEQTWLHMKPQQFMTLMLLLAIACFVASSYWEVLAATDMIETVRIEESKLLVHVHKVQQQALQLAENMKRIKDLSDGAGGAILSRTSKEAEGSGSEDSVNEVDGDLIRVQIDKLRDMEAELDHEVRTLRKNIQQAAKDELVKHYGEGAIQVFMEMDSVAEEGSENKEVPSSLLKHKNTVSMRLWYDTPHTAWTFLQQVEKGVWNGAVLTLDHARALSAEPTIEEGTPLRPNLDFLEPSDRGHDRYTVTLTDANLLINLQDNKKVHQTEEACVGVIFEGFDVLHTVVRESASRTVRIKKITAVHMTRAESGGLF